LNIEERIIPARVTLSRKLTIDMLDRIRFGKIVVVTDKPQNLLPAIKKQWLKELRKQQNKRASSLDAMVIERTTKFIALMQRTNFSTKSPLIDEFCDVFFTSPEKLEVVGMFGITVFVTCAVDKAVLYDVARFMPDDGLVVEYKRASA